MVRFGGQTERTRTVSSSSAAGDRSKADRDRAEKEDEGEEEDEHEPDEAAKVSVHCMGRAGRMEGGELGRSRHSLLRRPPRGSLPAAKGEHVHHKLDLGLLQTLLLSAP